MAIKIIKNTLTDPINKTCDECGSEFEFTYDDIQSGSYMGVFGNTINYRFIICPVCKHRCSFTWETDQCDLSKKVEGGVMKSNKKTPAEIIQAIITSYEYNRSDGHLLKVIKDVITRLEQKGPTLYYDDEDVRSDADIFNGILVVLYGDYGTSPRHGWLDNKYKDSVLKALKDELKYELSDTKIFIEMEPERYSKEELEELKSLIKQLEENNEETTN